ncbi:unnamed protein product, partial [Didymodactylos carnosus]
MKKLHLHPLIFGVLLGSWCNSYATEPLSVKKRYAPSRSLFANPERGWIVHRFLNDMWGLDELRDSKENVSLILIKIDISADRNSEHIGQGKLMEIKSGLEKCRTHGLKAILRSAYGWTNTSFPDPKNIQTIVTHVLDMKPIYNAFKDIIIAVEMGMFGPWGEMHSSTHSTINDKPDYPIKASALKSVHKAYMSALPRTRSVLLRRPAYVRQIFDSDQPLMSSDAYKNTAKARTGYFNDGYLNSEDDAGTFNKTWGRERELTYVNQMTRYTFFGGETYGTPNGNYNNAHNALLESKQQHMTYLHRDYDPLIYFAWGSSIKDDFTRQLGYRFQLESLSYSQQVAPGGIFTFHLKMWNVGFAAMHLHRPVSLILDNAKTGRENINYSASLQVDPRNWTPEAGLISIDRKFRIPARIKEGTWRLLLALPDDNPQLKNDSR